MSDFEKLDPETRTFALVGQFLQAWASMEASLHNAIGAALTIEPKKLHILCANIEFSGRIYILRTLIDISSVFPKEEKGKLQKTLVDLAEYAKLRNMIAHNQFQSDESKKGVEFSPIKARGKFDMPKDVWLPEKFKTEGEKIDEYKKILDGLEQSFLAQPLPTSTYVDALRYSHTLRPFLYMDTGPLWTAPMQGSMSPVLMDYLSRQAQAPPDSGQATQEKTVQTPQAPPKK